MTIELRFLKKATEDRNYISFTYQNKKLQKIKPLKLLEKENKYFLHTKDEVFEFDMIKKIHIHKEKF